MTLSYAGVPSGGLDAFLLALDAAAVGPPSALKSVQEKDLLETEVWTLAYRLDQVRYHRENLERLLTEDIGRTTSETHADDPPVAGAGLVERASRVAWDSRPAFELNAFLAALRSGLDTCANVAATFLKGHDRRHTSMGSLGKSLKAYEGTTVLLCLLRDEWNDWIEAGRDYRDDVIHRVAIRTRHRSVELRYEEGAWDEKTDTVAMSQKVLRPRIPVVIPRKPKPRELTRKHWFHYAEWLQDEGYGVSEGHGSVSLADGREFTMTRELEYLVAASHVELAEFVDELAARFESFIEKLLVACSGATAFQTIVERF